MKHIAILGAGTAGTMMANRLHRSLGPRGWSITVFDKDNDHIYQPGLLFVPFGAYSPEEIVRPRRYFVDDGVQVRIEPIDKVDPAAKEIHLGSGETLAYDILIVATGSRLDPDAVDGLTGKGWHESAFDFYTLEGATKLAETLDHFKRLRQGDAHRLQLRNRAPARALSAARRRPVHPA